MGLLRQLFGGGEDAPESSEMAKTIAQMSSKTEARFGIKMEFAGLEGEAVKLRVNEVKSGLKGYRLWNSLSSAEKDLALEMGTRVALERILGKKVKVVNVAWTGGLPKGPALAIAADIGEDLERLLGPLSPEKPKDAQEVTQARQLATSAEELKGPQEGTQLGLLAPSYSPKKSKSRVFDKLVGELISIGRDVGYTSSESPKSDNSFDEHGENVRARQIGKMLNKLGGTDLIQEALSRVNRELGSKQAEDLESAWHPPL